MRHKVVHASFGPVSAFRKAKEGLVASRFDVNGIELWIVNGDSAQWIQKKNGVKTISVLNKYRRNKKIPECIADKELAGNLRKLLLSSSPSAIPYKHFSQVQSRVANHSHKK